MTTADSSLSPEEAQPFVPLILRATARWCRWNLRKNRQGSWTKVPDCRTLDQTSQREFDDVAGPINKSSGIGFITTNGVATPRGYLVALDYDNCRNPETGRLSVWVRTALAAFSNSFTEVSPSGFGLRQWVLVDKLPRRNISTVLPIDADPVPGCTKRVEVQLFGVNQAGGFVTVTGKHLVCTNREVMRVNLDDVFRHFDWVPDEKARLDSLPTSDEPRPSWSDIDLYVFDQPHGESLVGGQWQDDGMDYSSASDAFWALEVMVAKASMGHGDVALHYLLNHTAWGQGSIENSLDPGRYGREAWVAADLCRAFAYIQQQEAELLDAFGEEQQALDEQVEASKEAAVKLSPIYSIESVQPDWSTVPAPREYLLNRPDGVGLLPRGKVGLFSAAGGTGKTTALIQLAVSVATGRSWLGHFTLGETCGKRVLFLMGEEDAEEAARKLYFACDNMGLDAVEMEAVRQRVMCVPLSGYALPLLDSNADSTGHSTGLVQRLSEGEDWGLVVVDPISRFAGVNVESDNILATRFVQELERFTRAPGNPTVLGVGHTSKQARAQGSAEQRGVTGLIDAVRWGASLLTVDDGRVRFEMQKNNLAPPMDEPVMLVRQEGGYLTAEDEVQRQQREEAQQAAEQAEDARQADRREQRVSGLVESVVTAVADHPGKTANELVSLVAGRRSDVLDAVRRAAASHRIVSAADGRRTVYRVEDLLG